METKELKEHLAKDAPVVIGMMVGGSFMQGMMGKQMWAPTDEDRTQAGFGGHAMCVIGYDDRKQAFQIMNSWGPEWGENGIGWVRYADFKEFVREAYGVDPMPKPAVLLQPIAVALKPLAPLLPELNLKWRSKIQRNAIFIFLARKQMAAAILYFLIPVKKMQPKLPFHLIAVLPVTAFFHVVKV